MDLKEIKANIISYVKENFPLATESDFSYDAVLFNIGMDSIAFMMLIVYMEEEFHLQVEDDILMNGPMKTVNEIVSYLDAKVNYVSGIR